MTKRLLSLILLFVWTLPALAQRVGPININSTSPPNNCATVSVNPSSSSTVYIDVDGTFSATLQAQVQRSGGTAKNVQVTPTSSSTPQATITASGAFWAGAAGVDTFTVCATSYVSGTASVSLTVSNGVASGGSVGGGGSVSSITAGAGLTGGTITTSGTIALSLPGSQFAPTYDNGAGALAEVSAPTSPNSVPQTLVSIPSGGLATAAIFTFAGVPIDASNPATLLATDRANFLNWTSGTALSLPAISGNFASNFPFVIRNTGGADLSITPTTPNNINGGTSQAADVLHTNYAQFIYNDNSNWFGIKFPAAGNDGSVSLTQTSQTGGSSSPAFSVATTFNNAGIVGPVMQIALTNTSSAGTCSAFNILGGTSAATTEFGFGCGGTMTAAGLVEAASGFQATGNATTTNVNGGLGTASVNGAVGGITVKGSDNSNTGASAAAGAATFRAGNLTGAATNRPGVDAILQGGLGTGNAAPGHAWLQGASFSNTSGTTAQTTVAEQVTHRKAGSTTSATATNMFNIAVATNQTIGVVVHVHVETTQATPHNCSTEETFVAAVQNTASTITSQTTAGTTATICDTGTLTLAAAFSSATPSVFSVTPSWTTIAPSGVIITVTIINDSQQTITLL